MTPLFLIWVTVFWQELHSLKNRSIMCSRFPWCLVCTCTGTKYELAIHSHILATGCDKIHNLHLRSMQEKKIKTIPLRFTSKSVIYQDICIYFIYLQRCLRCSEQCCQLGARSIDFILDFFSITLPVIRSHL